MDTAAKIMEDMIADPEGGLHDIEHLLKVWGYARTIGRLENLDSTEQLILEIAAITHDIACPVLRKKFGRADHRLQETEGGKQVRAFLEGRGLDQSLIDRVSFLVGHHHTVDSIDGPDWQILVEADYIVNASEKGYPKEQIRTFEREVMKTVSGRRLTESIFHLNDTEKE